MAIKNLKRHLAKIMTLIVAIGIIFSNTVMVQAAPVLIDGSGKLTAGKESSGGVVDLTKESANLFAQLRLYLGGCVGLVLITLVLVFTIKCGQLAASADNARRRSEHITGMLYLCIAVGCLGAFELIMNILATLAIKGF